MEPMAEFIVNPRRAPRAPARCRAAVVAPQGWFEAETEDIGSMGCQVVAPKLVRKGDVVQLVVTNVKLEEPLKVNGRVAWVSPQPPWRAGIAFDGGGLKESARWFDRLVGAYPGLGGYRRVPDRIRADATVYLGPPPKFLFDFNGEEAMLLRAIASAGRPRSARSSRSSRARRSRSSVARRCTRTAGRRSCTTSRRPSRWSRWGKPRTSPRHPPRRSAPPRPRRPSCRSGRSGRGRTSRAGPPSRRTIRRR